MALALLIDPAGQGAQTEPEAANVPATHTLQLLEEVDPRAGEIEPNKQDEHPEDPVVLL